MTVPTKTETKILHTGETITWHGKTITSGGMVEDRVPGVAESGCDSVYYLNVGDYASASPIDCVHFPAESHRALGLAMAEKVKEILG